MAEIFTAITKLVVVEQILEDETGATLRLQQGGQGRLARDANFATYLRLARRSHERQHPVGVNFGDGETITELVRADNDVPAQLVEEDPDRTLLLFDGHDGVFHLKHDHPDFVRIRTLLREALRQKTRVWFIAQKPDLSLLELLPADSAGVPSMLSVRIEFVVAPDHLLKSADEILRSDIRCPEALRGDIRAVAKAYIDEADELKRSVHEIQTGASRIQIESSSPQVMIEKANSLRTVQLSDAELQGKVRAVAKSYVLLAEKNNQLFDEFKQKYGDKLPPRN